MSDQPTKDVSAWKPTEEELVSLGFERESMYYHKKKITDFVFMSVDDEEFFLL